MSLWKSCECKTGRANTTPSHRGRQSLKKVGSFVNTKKMTLVYQKDGNAVGPLYVVLYKSEMKVILRTCQILF
jgi:hypothetical protein